MSTITKEWLQQTIAEYEANRDELPFGLDTNSAIELQAFKLALASLEAEPVYFVEIEDGQDTNAGRIEGKNRPDLSLLPDGINHLYASPPAPGAINAEPVAWLWSNRKHPSEVTLVRPEDDEKAEAAQWSGWSYKALYAETPVPVVPAELHPDTQQLVTDFCAALAEKLYKAQLKYGYDADWKQDGWPSQCQTHFHQHIAKGDPRDVAAYCAFMWYHGWKTEPAPVIQEAADREMLKRLAVILSGSNAPGEIRSLTVTARSFVERCKTLVKERDECRTAMLQSFGNSEQLSSPVVPGEKGSSLQLRNLIRQRHAEWSQATFGDVGPIGPLKHLSKEALEAAAEPEDLSEWADMQFLLWDAQRRAGISDGEITVAMEEKLMVNMARQWPAPKDGEPRLHIKATPQQEVKP